MKSESIAFLESIAFGLIFDKIGRINPVGELKLWTGSIRFLKAKSQR
mgnify:CR=1 FL=1